MSATIAPVTRVRLLGDFLIPGRRYSYGSHRSQHAELRLPRGIDLPPVVVLIHGGSWRARYGRVVMRGLAGDLLRRGWATWNIEYRRLGDGGGWPETFQDVAAAIDLLAELDLPLDLAHVNFLGHSAGGQLALWAAGRAHLATGAPGAHPRVLPIRVISQAGVCDLAGAHHAWRGGVVAELIGGAPDAVPERYAIADPMTHIPLEMPVLLVHGADDETVSVNFSRGYERASGRAGGEVSLVEIAGAPGGHRAHIDPRGAAWRAVVRWLPSSTSP